MVASGVVPTPGIESNRKLMLSSVKDVEFKIDKELMTSNNAYPVLSTLPKGLVYRVQLGVFKNAVPDYLYREFTPVSGEALNNGLTAYLAGYFERAALANGVKNDIRNLGYTDAFVVAYCDGQRIALAKALEYENSGACSIRGHEDLMVEAFSLLKKTDGDMTANTSKPREVFYTVQVASLTKEDKGKLSNVPELFYVPSKNGKFKYSSGKFSQLELAKSRRNVLRNEGYTDAYIVAYRDGIPVSFNEAEIALNYMREKPIETSIPKNNDLSGILDVLTNPVTIEWVKRDSNLTMEKLGNYNTFRYFVTDGKGTVSSVPIPAEECSPLE
ncbi:MAG: hypothetical protein EB153_08150, partial [Nitrosopumilaceae archaeon]|nr:hypothetical protein [Nitrosopumilaceae archaeon]